jgi:hypothetical protein
MLDEARLDRRNVGGELGDHGLKVTPDLDETRVVVMCGRGCDDTRLDVLEAMARRDVQDRIAEANGTRIYSQYAN